MDLQQRDIEGTMQELHDMSSKIIMSGAYAAGADEETARILQTELEFVNTVCSLLRNGLYDVLESGIIQDAMEKARQDFMSYVKQFDPMIDKWQDGINSCDQQESVIYEQNLSIRNQKLEKEDELSKLGMFDFAKKRDLKEEISQLKPIDPPFDFNEKRKELNGFIEKANACKKPFQNKIKGIIKYQDEVYIRVKSRDKSITQSQAATAAETFRRHLPKR